MAWPQGKLEPDIFNAHNENADPTIEKLKMKIPILIQIFA
jgi:hypothetical protein